MSETRVGETIKAEPHRLMDGWFDKYAPDHLSGIDLGCQHDPLNHTFRRWDVIFGDSDATYMDGVPDEKFHTVYASHLLEHIEDYQTALKNWWRILKPGGHLILIVPHRDLYEKKSQPPSNWNGEHKWFWLPDQEEPPRCLNLKHVLQEVLPDGTLVSFEILRKGWEDVGPLQHSAGEFGIEAILRK
jgi:SAM-dependent methyltransferase